MTGTTPTPQPLDPDLIARVRERIDQRWQPAQDAFALVAVDDVEALLAVYEALRTERDRLAAVIEQVRQWNARRGYPGYMTDQLMPILSAAPSEALTEVKREAIRSFVDGIPSRIVTIRGKGGLQEYTLAMTEAPL